MLNKGLPFLGLSVIASTLLLSGVSADQTKQSLNKITVSPTDFLVTETNVTDVHIDSNDILTLDFEIAKNQTVEVSLNQDKVELVTINDNTVVVAPILTPNPIVTPTSTPIASPIANEVIISTSPTVTTDRNLEQVAVTNYAELNSYNILSLLNNERTSRGLSVLTLDSRLNEVASIKNKDMFKKKYWAHTSPTGENPWDIMTKKGIPFRMAGENLAKGHSNSNKLVADWMSSSLHRDNILKPGFNYIGISISNDYIDGSLQTLITTEFID